MPGQRMVLRVLRLFSVLVALSCGGGASASTLLPLWEAKGPHGRLYLFGSIHVCTTECLPLPQAVTRRLAASRGLVVELDPRKAEVQGELMRAGSLPAGQRLPDVLPEEDWRLIETLASRAGLPVEMLAGMRPWLASTMLVLTLAQQSGFDVTQGVDLAIMTQAGQLGLPIEELETAAEQFAAFNAGSPAEQRQALHLGLEQMRDGLLPEYLRDLLKAWQTGDMASAQRLIEEGMPRGSELARALIDVRNERMASRLVKRMRDGRSRFVVVGIGHLAGANGVPALLAKRGYTLRQLSADD